MTEGRILFAVIVSVVALTIWGIATNRMTDEERDEMLDDEEFWL